MSEHKAEVYTSGIAILKRKSKRLVLLFILASVLSLCAIIMSAAASEAPVIIIDAGHGGQDGGAVGISGVLEKELNLKAALLLREYFINSGCKVIMTRAEDDDTDGSSGFNKKNDIYNRVKIADEHPEAVYLSVHMNFSPASRDKGFQVFYGSSDIKSAELAQHIHTSVGEAALVTRLREVKAAPETVYIMKNVKNPCVLIECGFISNAADEGLLKNENYLKDLTYALYCGVEKYLILHAS